MPNAGKTRIAQLDQKVTLYRGRKALDGMGGATQTLVPYASGLWAKIEPINGNERVDAGRTEALSRYLVTIRYRTGIKESDVIEWGARRLNIRFIQERGGREFYTRLECDLGARL